MQPRTHRRLSGVIGVCLLLFVGLVLLLFGTVGLDSTATVTQLLALVVAALLYLAATVAPLTPLSWYRVHGLGHVVLGVALPLGFVETLGRGGLGLVLLSGLAGLVIALLGVDMLVFAGRYTYAAALEETES